MDWYWYIFLLYLMGYVGLVTSRSQRRAYRRWPFGRTLKALNVLLTFFYYPIPLFLGFMSAYRQRRR